MTIPPLLLFSIFFLSQSATRSRMRTCNCAKRDSWSLLTFITSYHTPKISSAPVLYICNHKIDNYQVGLQCNMQNWVGLIGSPKTKADHQKDKMMFLCGPHVLEMWDQPAMEENTSITHMKHCIRVSNHKNMLVNQKLSK